MKKIICLIALACIGLSCSHEREQEEITSAKESFGVEVKAPSLTDAQQRLRAKFSDLSNPEFYQGMENLSKEEIQKKAIAYLTADCKAILLENGFTSADIAQKLENSEEKILLEAIKYFNNPNTFQP